MQLLVSQALTSGDEKAQEKKREGEEERTNRELVDQRERRAARNIEGRRLVSIMSARSDGEKTADEGGSGGSGGWNFLKMSDRAPDAPSRRFTRLAVKFRVIGSFGIRRE